MTLPHERTRAVIQVTNFLVRLSSPYGEDGLKGIPKAVREEARALLRHFPLPSDLLLAAQRNPQLFDAETVLSYEDEERKTK